MVRSLRATHPLVDLRLARGRTAAAVLAAVTPAGSALPALGGFRLIGLLGCVLGVATAAVTFVLPPRRTTTT